MKRIVAKKRTLGLAAGAAALSTFLFAVVLSPTGAQAACTSEQFTIDGTFDMDGYLACLAAESAPGSLPGTGSDSVQLAGVALGMAVVGAAAVATSKRNRRSVA
jgi:LPXTG-motif cell wall-anchored protein